MAERPELLGLASEIVSAHVRNNAIAIDVLAHQVTHPDATWTINPLASHTRARGGRRRRLDPLRGV